jgi:preprotein translocase subunit SecA
MRLGCEQADAVTVAQITYQSFFKLYPKLSGMTGTAKTEASAIQTVHVSFSMILLSKSF